MRCAGAAAAIALLLCAWAPGTQALPDVERLFGCPLDAPSDKWKPRARWHTTQLRELGIALSTPGAWELEGGRSRAILRSGSGNTTLRVTQSQLKADKLDTVKRATEQRELGPSHAGPACAEALAARIEEATGLEQIRVGVYGRPLGARQRSYAIYAPHRGGVLTLVLSIQWGRRAKGPDLEVVRRVLGGLRALP